MWGRKYRLKKNLEKEEKGLIILYLDQDLILDHLIGQLKMISWGEQTSQIHSSGLSPNKIKLIKRIVHSILVLRFSSVTRTYVEHDPNVLTIYTAQLILPSKDLPHKMWWLWDFMLIYLCKSIFFLSPWNLSFTKYLMFCYLWWVIHDRYGAALVKDSLPSHMCFLCLSVSLARCLRLSLEHTQNNHYFHLSNTIMLYNHFFFFYICKVWVRDQVFARPLSHSKNFRLLFTLFNRMSETMHAPLKRELTTLKTHRFLWLLSTPVDVDFYSVF